MWGGFLCLFFILRTAAALNKDDHISPPPSPLDYELWIKAQEMDVSCLWYIFFFHLFTISRYLNIVDYYQEVRKSAAAHFPMSHARHALYICLYSNQSLG